MERTYYLNNNGDKWIVVHYDKRGRADRSPMDFILVREDGTLQRRRADWYESFGNFATVSFRIKGVRHGGFFDNFARINGLPVLRRYTNYVEHKSIDTSEIMTDDRLKTLGAYDHF